MKKLAPFLGGAIIGGFTLLVAVIVISLSFQALGRIFPGSLLDQIVGLVLFDLAAFCWFYAFVYLSTSSMQYVWAAFGFLFGLGGAIALIAIEVGISSGMLEAEAMIKPLTYTFITAAIAHLVLLYLRHASAPEVSARISLGVEKAKIQDEGMRQAENHLDIARAQLGATISGRLLGEVLRDLNMDTPDIIDAKALPVDDSLFIPKNGYPASSDLRGFPTSIREEATPSFFPKGHRVRDGVDDLMERIKKPFSPRKTPSHGQNPHTQSISPDNSAVWIDHQDGTRTRLICMECFREGKPWTTPDLCEHIKNATGMPVNLGSTGPVILPEDLLTNPVPATEDPGTSAANTATAAG